MEFLGIGPTELVFILLIAIIVLGPKEMQNTGRTVGRWLNQFRESEGWKIVRDTTRELSNLPNKWMREANLEKWESLEGAQHSIDPRPGRTAPARMRSSIPSEGLEHSIDGQASADAPTPVTEEKPADSSDKHD